MTTDLAGRELLIRMDRVSVRFGQKLALDAVSLQIFRGELITVIGPNGAGKSTLLKTLLGTEKNHSGQIWRKDNISIGYVPQKLNINPQLPMSVKRFLSGLDNNQAMLERVGALDCFHTPIQDLSGGEFQRVLLARALLRRPDLIVLDEPVQGVDFHGQSALYKLMTDLHHSEGFAVLMVSHDLHVVMASVNRVICLNTHICCTGAPQQISERPEYQRLFGEQLGLYSHHVAKAHHAKDSR